MIDRNRGVWDSYIQSLECKTDYSSSGILTDIINIRSAALEKLELAENLMIYIKAYESSKYPFSMIEVENTCRLEIVIDKLDYLAKNSKFINDDIESIEDVISRIKTMGHIEAQRKKRVNNEESTSKSQEEGASKTDRS